jgi:hypothetical protein
LAAKAAKNPQTLFLSPFFQKLLAASQPITSGKEKLREVMMNVDSFYAIVSGICFALTGLWWTVVEGRKDWLADSKMRSLAGGVYASFLVPGVMSLGAQIGGDNKLVWRTIFVLAAVMGIIFTSRLIAQVRKAGQAGLFTRSRWIVVVLYILVGILALFPQLATPLGLTPIQVEAFLLCIIILNGHGLAWEMMTRKPAE